MSPDARVFIAILALFVIIGIAKNRKIQSEESYLFAERKCGLLGLTCTLIMTELNTATLLAFAGLGYVVGLQRPFLSSYLPDWTRILWLERREKI